MKFKQNKQITDSQIGGSKIKFIWGHTHANTCTETPRIYAHKHTADRTFKKTKLYILM